MRRRWHRDFEPITCTIPTPSGAHRLSWRRGKLVLHDHDLEAEQVLGALGAEPCPCLLVLDLFRERAGVMPVVRYRLHAGPTGTPASQTIKLVRSSPSHQQASPAQQNLRLRHLRQQQAVELAPRAMLELLASIHERRSERRIGRNRQRAKPRARDTEALLQSMAAPALEACMRRWRRDLRSYAPLTVECWKRKPGDEMLLHGDLTSAGGTLAISLPAAWLNRVGARGLVCVDGCFVVEVDEPAPADALSARALRWERRPGDHSVPVVGDCFISRSQGGWALSW